MEKCPCLALTRTTAISQVANIFSHLKSMWYCSKQNFANRWKNITPYSILQSRLPFLCTKFALETIIEFANFKRALFVKLVINLFNVFHIRWRGIVSLFVNIRTRVSMWFIVCSMKRTLLRRKNIAEYVGFRIIMWPYWYKLLIFRMSGCKNVPW